MKQGIRIQWLRTHVDVRNGRQGINRSFSEPEYSIDYFNRMFFIKRDGRLVTVTPIENVIEFTPQPTFEQMSEAPSEQEAEKTEVRSNRQSRGKAASTVQV